MSAGAGGWRRPTGALCRASVLLTLLVSPCNPTNGPKTSGSSCAPSWNREPPSSCPGGLEGRSVQPAAQQPTRWGTLVA